MNETKQLTWGEFKRKTDETFSDDSLLPQQLISYGVQGRRVIYRKLVFWENLGEQSFADKGVGDLIPLQDELARATGAAMLKDPQTNISELAESGELLTMQVLDGPNGETKTVSFPAMVESQDSWGIYHANEVSEHPNCAAMGQHYFDHSPAPSELAQGDIIVHEEMPRPKPEPYGLDHSENWVCTNHAPGSEVSVAKGEKCYCGRTK